MCKKNLCTDVQKKTKSCSIRKCDVAIVAAFAVAIVAMMVPTGTFAAGTGGSVSAIADAITSITKTLYLDLIVKIVAAVAGLLLAVAGIAHFAMPGSRIKISIDLEF